MEKEETSILILTHGRAGEELIKSAEMIAGEISNIFAVSLTPDMSPERYVELVRMKLLESSKEVLVFTDIFGGTPSNIARLLSKDFNIISISGLNLPMLLEAVFSRDIYHALELAEHIQITGKNSCVLSRKEM